MSNKDDPISINMNVTNLAPNQSEITDIIFNEFYQEKMQGIIAMAHMQGQAVGIQTMLTIMKVFEQEDILITVEGIAMYLEEIQYKPLEVVK